MKTKNVLLFIKTLQSLRRLCKIQINFLLKFLFLMQHINNNSIVKLLIIKNILSLR